MARNTQVSLTANTWGELTAGDVSAISIYNGDDGVVEIAATNGNGSAPAAMDAVVPLQRGEDIVNMNLSDLFPGVSGANRVWGRCRTSDTKVNVSHT
jgi:hypothetical protein